MALSPLKQDGFRTLFFSPLASNREFAVSTRVLRDKAMAESEERYANCIPAFLDYVVSFKNKCIVIIMIKVVLFDPSCML